MLALVDFLNKNSGAFSVIFSFFVASATVVYALLTSKLVSETKQMRQAQTEPDVCLYIQTKSGWFYETLLVIENIGLGPAFDIFFRIKEDIEIHKDLKLSDTEIIKNGIHYLAPGQKKYYYFLNRNLSNKIERPLEIEIVFKDRLNRESKNKFFISKEDFPGIISDDQASWIGKLTYEIKQLNTNIDSLNSRISNLTK